MRLADTGVNGAAQIVFVHLSASIEYENVKEVPFN